MSEFSVKTHARHHRSVLQGIAHQAMLERGFLPDFSSEVLAELEQTQNPVAVTGDSNTIRDQRNLLWASIDNNDSLDLDQLTVAQPLPAGKVKILVAIADAASSVRNNSAIDEHARHNTTSIYTAAEIFPCFLKSSPQM